MAEFIVNNFGCNNPIHLAWLDTINKHNKLSTTNRAAFCIHWVHNPMGVLFSRDYYHRCVSNTDPREERARQNSIVKLNLIVNNNDSFDCPDD